MFFRKCFSCRTFIISTDLERYWRWLGNGCCRCHSVRQHFSILRMKLHKLSISLNNYDHYESTRRDWIDLKWQNVNYFWFQYFIRSKPFTNGCCVCKSQNHNLWQKKQEKKNSLLKNCRLYNSSQMSHICWTHKTIHVAQFN